MLNYRPTSILTSTRWQKSGPLFTPALTAETHFQFKEATEETDKTCDDHRDVAIHLALHDRNGMLDSRALLLSGRLVVKFRPEICYSVKMSYLGCVILHPGELSTSSVTWKSRSMQNATTHLRSQTNYSATSINFELNEAVLRECRFHFSRRTDCTATADADAQTMEIASDWKRALWMNERLLCCPNKSVQRVRQLQLC